MATTSTTNETMRVQGTEYIHIHHWETVGSHRAFCYYKYVVDDGKYNPKNIFRTVAKTVEECRQRLELWAKNRRLELGSINTVNV